MNLDLKGWLRSSLGRVTLMGICPMFIEMVKASLGALEGFVGGVRQKGKVFRIGLRLNEEIAVDRG